MPNAAGASRFDVANDDRRLVFLSHPALTIRDRSGLPTLTRITVGPGYTTYVGSISSMQLALIVIRRWDLSVGGCQAAYGGTPWPDMVSATVVVS